MYISGTLKQIIAGALLSGGLAVAGSGPAGTAQAVSGPYHWCPGQQLNSVRELVIKSRYFEN
jgi:hypothetical protein